MLCDPIYVRSLEQSRSQRRKAEGGRQGLGWDFTLHGEGERPGDDGGDGRTTARMNSPSLHWTLKNDEDGKSHVMCIRPRFLKTLIKNF